LTSCDRNLTYILNSHIELRKWKWDYSPVTVFPGLSRAGVHECRPT
jgi:hypothetical protein